MSDRRSYRSDAPEPQYSRLFIVCSRECTADDFYNSFDKFGTIEDVRLVRDRQTGENKGIAYVKFSKTTEAAKALQEMNGRCVGSSSRPLKVLVANSRDEGVKRDSNEGEKYIRLFVAIPKSMNEDTLRDYFKQFGNIVKINLLRDRNTQENKGFAYITYSSFIEAATAYENCEKSYKAVFAEPKPSVKRDRSYERRDSQNMNNDYYQSSKNSRSEPPGQLIVTASPASNQDQIWRLFDLIPGLDYCQPLNSNNVFSVVYNNMKSAQTAREKLHGFEYPPGYRLIVKFDSDISLDSSRFTSSMHLIKREGELGTDRPDIAQLAETIAQATSIIKAAGLKVNPYSTMQKDSSSGENFIEAQCNVKLPPPQPLVSIDTPHAKRCFIVCSPHPPPIYIMRDVFSRFGQLIDVYILQYKNIGYAKYATVESADEAIRVMHGAELCGVRLKVLEADERKPVTSSERRSKRRRSVSPVRDDNEAWT